MQAPETARGERLLFVSPFFHPEDISTGRYNTYLVRALLAQGAHVDVIASHPFYPEWTVALVDAPRFGDAEVLRGGASVRYPGSQILRRLVLENWFTGFVRKAVRQRAERYDAVIVVLPPVRFVSAIRRVVGPDVKVVGIVHDLQGIMSGARAGFVRQVAQTYARHIEGRALAACDHLVYLSRAMQRAAYDTYDTSRIPSDVFYPFASLPESDDDGTTPEAIFGDDRRRLVYSGALGEKQAPELLMPALDRFARRHPEDGVHVFSAGPLFELWRERLQASQSPVRFHGLVPEGQLAMLLRESALQVIPQKLGLSHGAFPSKLANLIELGVPVFSVTDADSELAELLGDYSRGCAITNWDAPALDNALDRFWEAVAAPADEDADAALRDRFQISAVAERVRGIVREAGTA